MRQEYRYTVRELGPRVSTILEGEDQNLVSSYYLDTVSSFNPDESRLDVVVRDTAGNLLEKFQDIQDYAIRGVEQGKSKVHQLEVDPTIFMEDRTYLGDVIVEYKAFDNAFSKNAELYIWQISSDRTEIRAKSLTVSIQDLRYYTNLLQNKLNAEDYFEGAFLETLDGTQIPITNIVTEVVDSETVVTIKLYKALPASVSLKARFQVLESLGEATEFQVHRELIVIEDEVPSLKGPNFEARVDTSTTVTDYKNYNELLSQRSWENSKELYSMFRDSIRHTSIDYEDFSDFIHFSSAFERLENARYKFEKIFDYQNSLEASQSLGKVDDVKKLRNLIDGIIGNFDHYENYLWFESGSSAWPKKVDPDTGYVARPFVNVDHPQDLEVKDGLVEQGYETWYNDLSIKAESYDNNNKDILISTIPAAIREDLDHNEPYLIFVHMIGQHFDDLWIYARAITDRYSGDNRLDFGISKELVKDALESFGIDLYETNQNLNAFFDLCQPDGTYDWGEELEGTKFVKVSDDPSWIEQPLLRENYTKQIYKRIYHNVPALLKMKGTSRGLRVLLNCFGIPNDILTFRVQGGTNSKNRPFFGPEEVVDIYNKGVDENRLVKSPANVDKIRLNNKNEPILEYRLVDGTGSFYQSSTLSRYTSVTSSRSTFTDDSHKVEIGFDLNEAVNQFFQKHVGDFTVDDVIGDPRNKEEQYGDAWKNLREALLSEIPEGERFRVPAAIIRLVRYFDSTFFRMLKDFVPARASINSGVIVKDNQLHRNRWKGTTITWMELSKSGSISGSTVYGSHGGSFRHAGYKFDTTDKYNVVSTGDRWIDKGVLSGSREITGELAGSKIKVTDGDLSKYNEHRKDFQPANNFLYNFWFLDLPDPPLCRSRVTPEYQCEYWTFESVNQPTEAIISSLTETSLLEANQIYHAFLVPEEGQAIKVSRSHWFEDGYTFMGWYPNSEHTYGHAYTPGRTLILDPFVTGPKYQWKACYETASNRKMLWMECFRPEQDGVHYYYPDRDLLVSWKLVDSKSNPKDTGTESTGSVVADLGGITLKLLIDGEEGSFAFITLPDECYFGTNKGYYWAHGLTTPGGNIETYGIVSLGDGCTGPYFKGDTIIDAAWYDNYEDWYNYRFGTESWFWPVTVGTQTEPITPEV